MTKIVAEDILALRPCWPEEWVRSVVGRGLTPTQIATRADVSIADRRWALTRLAARTDAGRRALVLWAAGCAQDVAHLATDEDAARCAISVAVAWTEGCATVDEVRAAAAYAADAADADPDIAERHLLDLAAAMDAL